MYDEYAISSPEAGGMPRGTTIAFSMDSDKTLSEIATECGFADQPHFTRLLRRLVGESPSAWRRARANPSP